MLAIKERIAKAFDPPQASVLNEVIDLHNELVKASDFTELKSIVKDLAQAQQRTEERLGRLEAAVERLAEAQLRTEDRVGRLEAAVERLAEAQQRTEDRVGRLEAAVERLAEAQLRTEDRVGRLEAAVERLAEAQRRTEVALQRLSRQVGGLSETVGGDIEDIAYIVLHDVLQREFGWQVGVLERQWQTWGKEPEEVNILGQARDPSRPDQVIYIVGEAKHNLTAKEVEKFIGQLKRAGDHLEGEIFPVCFCYRARPEVQQKVKDAGIRLVFSYGKIV